MTDGWPDRDPDSRGRDDASRDGTRPDDREDGRVDRRPDEGDDAPDAGDAADGPSLAGVLGAGEEDTDRAIEPGTPSLENAVFVLLGVLFACFVIYRAWAVFVGG